MPMRPDPPEATPRTDTLARLEGLLRIEAIVEHGVVRDAFSAGTPARGLGKLLVGRDPREAWALTERVGGVCTTVHALASCRAVEDALGVAVPPNAERVRNIMSCAQFVQDHVVQFYHKHALDWVDARGLLEADPAGASSLARSLSPRSGAGPAHFADVQQRLKPYVEGGQFGSHGPRRLPPELTLVVLSHYLDALAWQGEILKLHALFGGRSPHPAYRVGGVPCTFTPGEPGALGPEALETAAGLARDAIAFVDQVYLPDLLAVAACYKDYAALGAGGEDFLAYGDLPTRGYRDPASFLFPRGAILGRNLDQAHEVDDREILAHLAGDPVPRWRGRPMEVGPLARVLVACAKGAPGVRERLDQVLGQLALPAAALFSTLGRTLARGVETQLAAHWLADFLRDLVSGLAGGDLRTRTPFDDPGTLGEGLGLVEAPRGALSHWLRLQDRTIAAYRMVIPSTWNAAPRDPGGPRPPWEAALVGTPVASPEHPVELLRTLHAFDPCVPCELRLRTPEGAVLHQVQFH